MKFYVVTGQIFNGHVKRAVICEERAVRWAKEELENQGYDWTSTVPAECHWTAQIVHPREGGDLETGWEG